MTDLVFYKIFYPIEISSPAVMAQRETQITSISNDALVTLLYSDVGNSF